MCRNWRTKLKLRYKSFKSWWASKAALRRRGAILDSWAELPPGIDQSQRWRGDSLENKRVLVIGYNNFMVESHYVTGIRALKQRGTDSIMLFRIDSGLMKALLAENDCEEWPQSSHADIDCYLMLHDLLLLGKPAPFDLYPRLERNPWLYPYEGLGLKVGVNWVQILEKTSIQGYDPSVLQPLFDELRATFFSFHPMVANTSFVAFRGKYPLVNIGGRFIEKEKLYQRLEQMDVIIAIDEAVALIALAMGKRVFYLDFSKSEAVELFRDHPLLWICPASSYEESLESIKKIKPLLKSMELPKALHLSPVIHETSLNRVMRVKHGAFCVSNHDIFITTSLQRYGEYNEQEVKVYQQFIKPGQVVVEIGANNGVFTVIFSKLVGPKGRVYAYEPMMSTFQLLAANVALNGCFNVLTYPYALGEKKQSLNLIGIDPTVPLNRGGVELETANHGYIPGQQYTLDSLAMPRCDFIKIDVEGMELEVLKGATNKIKQFRPIIFFESDRKDKAAPLHQWMQAQNYRLMMIKTPLSSEDNYNHNPDPTFFNVMNSNVLAIPIEKQASLMGKTPPD